MKRLAQALPFAVAVLSVLASGCGSTAETNVTGPGNTRCQPTLGAPSTNFGPSGGTGTVAVSVARECSWSAASGAPWITLTEGQQGQGDGTITFRVVENADPTSRRGAITVADQAVQLAQDPAPCRYSVQPAETTAPAAGGDVSVEVRTHALCNWTASAGAPWMSPSPASGRGNAAVRVAISANESTSVRTADVTVAGQAVTLTQEARAVTPTPPSPTPPSPTPPSPTPPSPTPPSPTPPTPPAPGPPAPPAPTCAFELSSTSQSVPATGGPGTVRIRTTAACAWTASSSEPWVTVSTPAGVGESDVRFTVGENFTTASRSATLTIGTRTLRITQAGAEEIRFDGRISGLTGSCPNLRFTVANRVVTTNRETDFRGGNCERNARNGQDVSIRGFRQPDGTVLADRVEFDN